MAVEAAIVAAFERHQRETESSVADLVAEILEHEPDAVQTALLHICDCILAAPSNVQVAVETTLDLLIAVAIQQEAFLLTIISRSLECTDVLLERVRASAATILGAAAGAIMPLSLPSKDALLDRISQALVARFTDKSALVRAAAITASAGFFDATTTDQDLLQALLYASAHDPSSGNRALAIAALPINLSTIDALVARTRDVKAKPRAAAWHRLAAADDCLESEHLAALVDAGWTERDPLAKVALQQLVCSVWIKSAGYQPLALLQRLSVEDFADQCATVVEILRQADDSMLDDLSEGEKHAFFTGIDAASVAMTADAAMEHVFWVRVVAEQTRSSTTLSTAAQTSLLDRLLPDLSVIGQSLEQKIQQLMTEIEAGDEAAQDRSVVHCQQLLKLAVVGDLEEGTRRRLVLAMKGLLSSILVPDDLLQDAVQVLQTVCGDHASLIEAALNVVEALESSMAENVSEVEENHRVRMLSVVMMVLEKVSTAAFGELIVESLENDSELVREAAVQCLGKLGLLTPPVQLVRDYKPLLLEMADNADETPEIRAQAVLALSDWTMVFPNMLESVDGRSVASIVETMMEQPITEESQTAVCIAAETAAKLLFAGKMIESRWLARLVLIYFDKRLQFDDNEEEDVEVGSPIRLQQLLTVFFPAYCSRPEGRDAFVGAVGDLLKLATAGKKKVQPFGKLIGYIAETAQQSGSEEASANVDAAVAMQVAAFLVDEHDNLGVTQLRALTKILAALEIADGQRLGELKGLVQQLSEQVTDKASRFALEQVTAALAHVAVEEESEEEETEEEDELQEAEEDNEGVEQETEDEETHGADEECDANDVVAADDGFVLEGHKENAVGTNRPTRPSMESVKLLSPIQAEEEPTTRRSSRRRRAVS